MVVLILQEEVLECAVGREGNGRDAQAGEEALEPVPSGEGASVAPSLTKKEVRAKFNSHSDSQTIESILASPGIPLSVNGGWRGRGLELGHIEAGGVSGGHDCEYESNAKKNKGAECADWESQVKPRKGKDVKPVRCAWQNPRDTIPDTEHRSSPAFRGTNLTLTSMRTRKPSTQCPLLLEDSGPKA